MLYTGQGLLVVERFVRVAACMIVVYIAAHILTNDARTYDPGSHHFLNAEALMPVVSIGHDQDFYAYIKGRQIFGAPVVKEEKKEIPVDPKQVQQMVAGLKLVGIIPGERSQAVIESSRAGRSFYVYEGDAFLEGMTVMRIAQGVVDLEVLGELVELRL